MDLLIIALNTLLSATVLWGAICATNRMTKETTIFLRSAYILMGTGAAGCLLYPFWFEDVPNIPELLVIGGVAIIVVSGRRRRLLS